MPPLTRYNKINTDFSQSAGYKLKVHCLPTATNTTFNWLCSQRAISDSGNFSRLYVEPAKTAVFARHSTASRIVKACERA